MKKAGIIILIAIVFISVSALTTSAQTLDDLSSASGADKLSDCLPDYAVDSLNELGLSDSDFSTTQNLSFSSLLSLLIDTAGKEAQGILPSAVVIIAVLLLYSIFGSVFDSVTNPALTSILSVVSSLCISCALLLPVTDIVESVKSAIEVSSNFMLVFIPIMAAILISSGQAVMSSGYSAMMLLAAEGVAQFFSKVINSLLSCLLSLGISSSVIPEINISSIVGFFSKSIKWLLSFVFTIFTSLLTIKSLYAASVDNVSSRALRYTMSSFVPVVGGALSEAYRTVHGSVGVLKSGVGIFVIIAVFAVFIPVIIRLLLWLMCINTCKCFAEISALGAPQSILSSVGSVLSLLLSVVLCIIALFVISTALVITAGGI